jgi:type III secretory pathway component EscT
MSTGLLTVAIGFLVLLTLIEITGVQVIGATVDEKSGKLLKHYDHPFKSHGSIMAIVLIVIAAIIFWFSGGAALIGIMSLPTIGAGSWLLIIVGAAVLWMLSEREA